MKKLKCPRCDCVLPFDKVGVTGEHECEIVITCPCLTMLELHWNEQMITNGKRFYSVEEIDQ